MEYRVLGRTGLNIAPICFGTGNFGEPTPEDEAKTMIDRALDAGINLLGTGNIYADGEGGTDNRTGSERKRPAPANAHLYKNISGAV